MLLLESKTLGPTRIIPISCVYLRYISWWSWQMCFLKALVSWFLVVTHKSLMFPPNFVFQLMNWVTHNTPHHLWVTNISLHHHSPQKNARYPNDWWIGDHKFQLARNFGVWIPKTKSTSRLEPSYDPNSTSIWDKNLVTFLHHNYCWKYFATCGCHYRNLFMGFVLQLLP